MVTFNLFDHLCEDLLLEFTIWLRNQKIFRRKETVLHGTTEDNIFNKNAQDMK